MTREQHIFVVDDDPDIRELLSDYLRRHGFATSSAGDAREFFRLLPGTPCDLVVLDIMLPGADGYETFRRLRAFSAVPVIFLTALGDITNRVVGLELGADDYLAKPFEPRELLARIRTVLRRAGAPGGSGTSTARALRFAGWLLDRAVVHLSGAELRLLRVFLEHPQQVLSRDELLERTQGRDATAFDRSIDVQVSRLRVRLRDNGREARIIKTVRGDGYVLAADVFPASLPEYGGEAH